jgi:hypothetical protein
VQIGDVKHTLCVCKGTEISITRNSYRKNESIVRLTGPSWPKKIESTGFGKKSRRGDTQEDIFPRKKIFW